MSYLLDKRQQYRNANANFDKGNVNQKEYDSAIRDISQSDRDKYADEMVRENGPSIR